MAISVKLTGISQTNALKGPRTYSHAWKNFGLTIFSRSLEAKACSRTEMWKSLLTPLIILVYMVMVKPCKEAALFSLVPCDMIATLKFDIISTFGRESSFPFKLALKLCTIAHLLLLNLLILEISLQTPQHLSRFAVQYVIKICLFQSLIHTRKKLDLEPKLSEHNTMPSYLILR
jgi:hypothetical protein